MAAGDAHRRGCGGAGLPDAELSAGKILVKFRNNARLSEIFNTYSKNISGAVYLRKPLYIIFEGD